VSTSISHDSSIVQDESVTGGESESLDSSHLRSRGERIVIIDDEDPVILVTEKALERLGYVTTTYNSTERFLKSLSDRAGGVDLVVTDLIMPGMSGLELTRKLRAAGHDFPVLLMTGFSKHLRPKAVEGLGRVSLLRKPFSCAHLAQSVRRALTTYSRV
jgi:CheY-like chemotaxis protein